MSIAFRHISYARTPMILASYYYLVCALSSSCIGVFLFIYRVVIGFLSVLKRYIILCFFHVLSVDFGLVRFISSFFFLIFTIQ